MYPQTFVSPLPWYTGAISAFRLRQVSEWLIGSKMGPIWSLLGGGRYIGSHLYVYSHTSSVPLLIPWRIVAQLRHPCGKHWVLFVMRINQGPSESPQRGCSCFWRPCPQLTHSIARVTSYLPTPMDPKHLTCTPQFQAAEMWNPLKWSWDGSSRGSSEPRTFQGSLFAMTFVYGLIDGPTSLPYPLLRVEHTQTSEAIRVTYRHFAPLALSEGAPSFTPTSRTLTYEFPLDGGKSPASHHPTSSEVPPVGSDLAVIGPLIRADFVLPDR